MNFQTRLGHEAFEKRMDRENNIDQGKFKVFGFDVRYVDTERFLGWIYDQTRSMFWMKYLVNNCSNYQVSYHTHFFKNLPQEWDGVRVLHLSDLHIEAVQDGGASLGEIIRRLSFDLCVITGDFRHEIIGHEDKVIETLKNHVLPIPCKYGTYAVLGNHDSLEVAKGLESLGVHCLMNESMELRAQQESVWIVGVDDPHYYQTHDLRRAFSGVPSSAFKIFLAHTSEIIHEASEFDVQLYLCGHSHGGQICFPKNIPIIRNTRASRRFLSGLWDFKGMTGYTSRGTGFSGLPARFLCRPELAIHELKKAD